MMRDFLVRGCSLIDGFWFLIEKRLMWNEGKRLHLYWKKGTRVKNLKLRTFAKSRKTSASTSIPKDFCKFSPIKEKNRLREGGVL
jgi:hypothetical protein